MAANNEAVKGRVASIHRAAEKAHSRKPTVASSATNLPFYSAQSSVLPLSCCFWRDIATPAGRICYEELQVVAAEFAGELVLCSPVRTARSIGYTGLSSQGGRRSPLSRLWPFVGRYTSYSAPYP